MKTDTCAALERLLPLGVSIFVYFTKPRAAVKSQWNSLVLPPTEFQARDSRDLASLARTFRFQETSEEEKTAVELLVDA